MLQLPREAASSMGFGQHPRQGGPHDGRVETAAAGDAALRGPYQVAQPGGDGVERVGGAAHAGAFAALEGVEFAAAGGGCDLIDTADMYSRGQSEEMVGEALAARSDDVMLATKAALPMSEEHNHQGASRRWLAKALDDCLRRLGVDHIEMALGFVTAHPLVTSALIGPRTRNICTPNWPPLTPSCPQRSSTPSMPSCPPEWTSHHRRGTRSRTRDHRSLIATPRFLTRFPRARTEGL